MNDNSRVEYNFIIKLRASSAIEKKNRIVRDINVGLCTLSFEMMMMTCIANERTFAKGNRNQAQNTQQTFQVE